MKTEQHLLAITLLCACSLSALVRAQTGIVAAPANQKDGLPHKIFVTTSNYPAGAGTSSGGGSYAVGKPVKLKATAKSGSVFLDWKTNGVVASTTSSYIFNAGTNNETVVADFGYTVTTTASPAAGGITTGAGAYTNSQTVTITATPNGCYDFVNWTKKSGGGVFSTDPTLSFSITNGEALVAHFTLKNDIITTISNPPNGGTTSGGGAKDCGAEVTVKAVPAKGYRFIGWTIGAPAASTNNPYKFTANESVELTANFSDISVPKVAITSPTATTVDTTLLIVSGSAGNSAGVSGVQVGVNGSFVSATSTNSWTNWTAGVILAPGTNTISAYALSDAGAPSPTEKVTLVNTATGQAPVALAGLVVEVQPKTKAPFQFSFGAATFEQFTGDTNQGSSVGNYTYTQTGPDTATLINNAFAPPNQTGTGGAYLTFTSPTNATFTSLDGNDTGTLTVSAGLGLDISSRSGWTYTSVDGTGNKVTTTFGDGTFTSTDDTGATTSGGYTSMQYGPMAVMIVETNADPGSIGVETNFILVTSTSRTNGQWFAATYDSAGDQPTYDSGTSTGTYKASGLEYLAPASLNGLSFGGGVVTFGQATYAQTSFSSSTNDLSEVGNYIYTRTGAKTAIVIVIPYLPQPTDGSSMNYFTFQSASEVTIENASGSSTDKGTLTAIPADGYFAPTSLPPVVTVDFDAVVAVDGGSSALDNGDFTIYDSTGKSSGKAGTYTYSQFSPTVGLIKLTYTNLATAVNVDYFQATFNSATGGSIPGDAYSSNGEGKITIGSFKIAK